MKASFICSDIFCIAAAASEAELYKLENTVAKPTSIPIGPAAEPAPIIEAVIAAPPPAVKPLPAAPKMFAVSVYPKLRAMSAAPPNS